MTDLSPTLGIFEPTAAEEIESTLPGDLFRGGHIINPIIVRSTSQLQYLYANT